MRYLYTRCLKAVLLAGLMISGAVLAAESPTTAPKRPSTTPTAKSPELLRLEAEQEKRDRSEQAQAEAVANQQRAAKILAEAEVKQKQAAKLAALEKIITEAESLMASNQSLQAYLLLLPNEFEHAGDKRFDYLLGISALDSGKPDKATLAFERVLAVDPNFAGARLDMARAYYQLGDVPRARTEFEAVLKQDPPEAARLTILKYLGAITKAEEAQRLQISMYLEGSYGSDSNANNSTSQSEVKVPAFGNIAFTLNPSNVQTPDNYYTGATGIDINNKLNGEWSLYLGGDARKRGNQHLKTLDYGSLDIRAGLTYGTGDDVFRAGATFSQFSVDHETNRNSNGLSADWRHSFSPVDQLNFFANYGGNRFVDSTMKVNDSNQTVLGTSFLHILENGKTATFGSFNVVNDKAVNGRADGNKKGLGLRLGGQSSLIDNFDLFANLGCQTGKYDKDNAAFSTPTSPRARKDTTWDWSFGLNWHLDKNWTLRPQMSYTNNISNIPIYSFTRTDRSITLRRDFK